MQAKCKHTLASSSPEHSSAPESPAATQPPTHGHRMQYLLSGSIALGWGLLITATLLDDAPAQPPRTETTGTETGIRAQEPGAPQTARTVQSQGHESSADRANDGQPRGESPALGVIVADCPADAVCVRGTVWGSPAEQADIREGDYILSLNGTKVTSPAELRRAVEQSDADEKASVLVWRDGDEITKELYLAQQSEEIPAGHRAWLGVQLTESDDGVQLAHVIEYGPADEAGLRDGDIVLQLDGDRVSSVEEFADRVGDLGPGKRLDLLVRRGSERQKITAELGTIDDAPMAFLRQAFGTPSWEGESATSIESDAMVDATLDVLRQQIRDLQQQMEELNNARGVGNERRQNNRGQLPAPDAGVDARVMPQDPQSSQLENNPESAESDRAEADQVGLTATGSTTDLSVAIPLNAALGSLIASPQVGTNQRQLGRANRPWNNWQRYRNYYNRNNNSRFYNYSPYYRSPYYGNSYYRYGGRQFYYSPRYGYSYGYGLRNGLRLGPNLGVYWY